ncbi:hypothetical protein OPV22_002951 [Ensete ventricosum]|uniref:Uncharacterized protein n=1 Tax=Ensete ventricosum TaxID=4639 RepID=A0AAV8RZ61_ENSVE|nr:hypothetical protein OPV22_002951 [Ensete ventricosum]
MLCSSRLLTHGSLWRDAAIGLVCSIFAQVADANTGNLSTRGFIAPGELGSSATTMEPNYAQHVLASAGEHVGTPKVPRSCLIIAADTGRKPKTFG